MNINGWNTIKVLLERNKKTQSDLAKILNITAPAVTQIKNQLFSLSAEKLELICHALHATKAEKEQIYSEVVNARLFHNTEKVTVKLKVEK